MKSEKEIREKIDYLKRLKERSKQWKVQDEYTKLFRDIIDAEINTLEWVLHDD